LFTGLRYETETGLYYSRMRDLDYLAGRFTTRDPLGIWRDLYNMGNGYTYVGNGPMSATDPMGTTTVTYIGNFPCGTGWPAGCYRMCFQYDTPTESYIGCFLRNVSSSLAVQWPPSGGGLGVGNTYPGAGTGSTLVAEGANDPLVGVGVGLGHICRDAQNNIIPCNSGLAITINNYRSNVKDNSPYQGPSSGGDPGVGPIYSADPIAGQAVQQERMTVPGSNRCVCSKGISGS
jgi:RHS repeat-associated protein